MHMYAYLNYSSKHLCAGAKIVFLVESLNSRKQGTFIWIFGSSHNPLDKICHVVKKI